MKNYLTEMCYDLIIATLKANAPKKSGNLATNSIRRVEDHVVIGGEIAPYAKYTEETNKSSKGWIERTINGLIPIIESYFKQSIDDDTILELTRQAQEKYQNDINDLIAKEQKKIAKIKEGKNG